MATKNIENATICSYPIKRSKIGKVLKSLNKLQHDTINDIEVFFENRILFDFEMKLKKLQRKKSEFVFLRYPEEELNNITLEIETLFFRVFKEKVPLSKYMDLYLFNKDLMRFYNEESWNVVKAAS
ncbi:hypothetical protein [Lentimicrobium sp. S6]|uniref:hypothetical protein n=1 Tax=Lentimicrobium sp. S6 TaxID=2735872 RepID=UPI0015578570|nr:hypothetical protein [Lentimicrobium sp. S6]NPD48019.1 hypothetical protein [Lentimicrobium sp. S6]